MSFELFVRPFVWKPVWPPAPAQPVVPEDTPEQGVAVLRGLGGKLIDLTFSTTHSWSRSKPVEVRRQVDGERVYQKEPGPGKKINPENYVDIERVKRLIMQNGDGTKTDSYYAVPDYQAPDRYNIEVLEQDVWIENATSPQNVGDTEEGGTPP